MRKIAWLLIALFCSAMVAAQNNASNGPKDSSSPKEMTGWICDTNCVDQSSGTAACKNSCSETSGKVVFINSDGRVLQIANQTMAQPMSGKKCKIKATKDPDSGMLAVQNIVEYRGP